MEIEKLIEQITEEIYQKISKESKGKIQHQPQTQGLANVSKIAGMIDHTLLKPEATEEQIKKLCKEALEYKFASVCVNPCYVPLTAKLLSGSAVKTCCVVGFPLGAATTRAKVEETKEVVQIGAQEVDMVINIGMAKSGNWDFVKDDIEAVVKAANGKALVKVILETCLLSDEEKVRASIISKIAGADFVKTSTGFSTGGATIDDVALMRKVVGPEMGVKASGGVKDYNTAMAMISAGATRIGTSSGIAIVKMENPSSGSADSAKNCINCGKCNVNCPTGNKTIIKNDY